MALHDEYALDCTEQNPDALVAWVLMAAYAYYHLDDPILSDECNDALCKRLYKLWNIVRHPHKALIKRKALKSASLYYLREEDFRLMTRHACRRVLRSGRGMEWLLENIASSEDRDSI